MPDDKQKTVRGSASYSGIALHTGARATVTLKPAPENTGIVFSRVDLPTKPRLRALATNVVDVRRGTTIKEGEAVVYTVEHVLAALHVAGIDNALIEMDGPEPPIGDGSAKPYWDMVEAAGVTFQNAPARFWELKTPLTIAQGDTKLALFPDEKFRISCIVSFGATPLDSQFLSATVTPDFFRDDIASSRTFVLYRELEQLLSMGLVKGGSLDNAIIIHDGAVISKEGLRFPDELVRHKIIDIIGDLYLVGARVKAHVLAHKPGHPANVAMALKMLQSS